MKVLENAQVELLAERMPQIMQALVAAHDAARGFREPETDESRGIEVMSEKEGLERLKALDLGALIDTLNDWCWCNTAGAGVKVHSCPETVKQYQHAIEAPARAEKAYAAWKKLGRAKSNEVDLSHTYGEAEHELLVRVRLNAPDEPAEVVAVGPDDDESAEAGLDFDAIKAAIEADSALIDDLRLQAAEAIGDRDDCAREDAADRAAEAARDR
jgi:hypothetical protein